MKQLIQFKNVEFEKDIPIKEVTMLAGRRDRKSIGNEKEWQEITGTDMKWQEIKKNDIKWQPMTGHEIK